MAGRRGGTAPSQRAKRETTKNPLPLHSSNLRMCQFRHKHLCPPVMTMALARIWGMPTLAGTRTHAWRGSTRRHRAPSHPPVLLRPSHTSVPEHPDGQPPGPGPSWPRHHAVQPVEPDTVRLLRRRPDLRRDLPQQRRGDVGQGRGLADHLRPADRHRAAADQPVRGLAPQRHGHPHRPHRLLPQPGGRAAGDLERLRAQP
ncbi:hypothetical protein G6F57_011137 [Rhizopus arrhizus]|nr:hypothetical protein G6F65_012589 [Rhizopus arrhizus]KAG1472111.1 hypothetical protein G6F57_011137 [Rhizopus arrhizus]